MWNDQAIDTRSRVNGSPEDWAAFKSVLKEAPPETAFVLLRVMGERLSMEADPEWAIEDASDVEGLTIAGAALMVRATRLRGMDTADQVAVDSWAPYLACRDRAEEILRAAIDLRPGNGLAAAWFMASAVDSDDETKDQAAEVLNGADDVPISGYSKLLSARTEKWGGSHEAMWLVARRYAAVRAPWTKALVAKAHYEHWLYLAMMDERPEAAREAGIYFSNPVICNELVQISEEISTAPPRDPYEVVYAHDVLAVVLAEARMRRAAAAHLRKVGKHGDPALLTGGPAWQRLLRQILKGLPPW